MKSLRVTRAFALCTLPVLLALNTAAHAETFRCARGDTGCLIASIAKSNANGPAHDYLYLERGSYFLTQVDNGDDIEANGLPVITGALTIVGAGQGVTLIARTPTRDALGRPINFRLFEIAPTGGLTIAYTTLSQGSLGIALSRLGGCIANAGSLMVYHSTIRECLAWLGGGIYNTGQLTLESATLLGNKADSWGGNIATTGPTVLSRSWIGEGRAEDDAGISCFNTSLRIERSVIDSNETNITQAFQGGGGIGGDCTVDIVSSLISNNASYVRGGGMYVHGGTTTVKNSTFWGNTTAFKGGALYARQGAIVDLQNVAVLFNKANGQMGSVSSAAPTEGGGIYIEDGAVATMENSWLLWNEAGTNADCVGELAMEGWNVVGDPGRFTTQDADPCRTPGAN